ncbi:MAG: hypothetical protein BECKG1743E_GA0114224_104592 [Candidatus Kentron sp. G]|nr:MAG: hypothetical protein BECKG1743E_GA0114224_104592 [Candidatus Kentron sp. G]
MYARRAYSTLQGAANFLACSNTPLPQQGDTPYSKLYFQWRNFELAPKQEVYMTPNHGEPWCFCNAAERDSGTAAVGRVILSQPLGFANEF